MCGVRAQTTTTGCSTTTSSSMEESPGYCHIHRTFLCGLGEAEEVLALSRTIPFHPSPMLLLSCVLAQRMCNWRRTQCAIKRSMTGVAYETAAADVESLL